MANGVGKKVTLAIVLILAVLIGLMSAYGAMCPAYHPERILIVEEGEILELSSYKLYQVITQYNLYYIIANIATWVASILGILCIVALFARWKAFWGLSLFTSFLGVISGFVPWFLLYINGGSTPSYMRTILWGIVVIMLAIFYPTFKSSNIANVRRVKKRANITAAVLFFPGVVIAIQSLIVGPSHIMAAADLYMSYGMIEAIQIGLGLLLVAVGILVFALSKLKKPN
ncbi:MAG: hypothetical protein JW776_12875 [Candidatus Lokiarchaeota archaeon]|nr:hypothetical protein [Candidatus Lokiarchaeota archaeon]